MKITNENFDEVRLRIENLKTFFVSQNPDWIKKEGLEKWLKLMGRAQVQYAERVILERLLDRDTLRCLQITNELKVECIQYSKQPLWDTIPFSKDELRWLDINGFELTSTQIDQASQQVEDWIYDE